ncbi:aminoglycoside phosphotransferase family protein [Kribbella sp. VKM Ac-2566]|uniref:aminoglycoside phosphotransferase family protein n=1 Tax=Kribbella sp. VKM Ac-2566 TaxID=2512218 RepID=UPI001062B1DF|nr:aminoglycoside phosphotransferase family protein [Kribbella sp. VKM Ac-2566]TDW83468.1 aminoglycoside phosphotransferase (APT) family kinase protein [Kribbella sp. VKM Ac-2566]
MELIGQGMEGAVYDLGDGTVRKVWFDRRPEDVRPLKAFLDELPELPFRTPRIREITAGEDGLAVSVEDKLTGVPLHEAGLPEDVALDAFVAVVEALREVRPGPASKAMPVVGQPFWGRSWGESLAGLVRRRAEASRAHLERDVSGFPALLDDVLHGLTQLEDASSVVHGDICPPNLLMDGQRVAAVLDWGFLSTAGDSTFEASLAAGFFDMYSPDARRLDDLLTARFEDLGHDRERMRLYRRAYAIITATIYDENAGDGHYTWCVNQLTR